MFENKKIHFIGIGGISMSGIASIMQSKGAIITGSDEHLSKNIINLQEEGINITIGTNTTLVKDADIIVYTSAINEDNEELKIAKSLNKKIYNRSEFLGLLTKEYENVICIAGTHGKSTTTGMLATCFLNAKLNPTIQIGAILPKIKANYHVGSNKYFIMEACEYKDSFLNFNPTCATILNIDDDHLDYFKNIENIKKSFTKFINLLPRNNYLVINADDDNTMSLKYHKDLQVLTYGINKEAVVKAANISYDSFGYPTFDVYYNNEYYLSIHLHILGYHNIYNALATICMGIIYNLKKEDIKNGLEEYLGVERRFELLGKYKNNILVYDDYAHHPTEIKSTLNATKNIKCHQNWAIFQSHTFSRTKEHLQEFADVLKYFDNIIIAPIYPARETNIYNVKENDLVDLIKPNNPNTCYISSYDNIVSYLKDNLRDNDLVITIGAGPINEVDLKLLESQ